MSRIIASLLLAVAVPGLAHAANTFHGASSPSAPGRALVLEPFGTALGFGSEAGSQVADTLTNAGFQVDVLRDDQVTVPVMEHLSDYSVIYLETHSETFGSHGFVLTADADSSSYVSMRKDCASDSSGMCALMQGFADNDPSHLYNAITDLFIQDDLTGSFPNSSVLFINGCAMLAAPGFWGALKAKNAGVMVSWDDKVDSAITEASADVFFQDLAKGMSVQNAISDVTAQGLGTSTWGSTTSHLGFMGDGTDTLARAKAGDPIPPTATPVPTAAPTVAPKPTSSTPVKKAGKCKKGHHHSHGKCVKTKKKKKK